MSITWFITPYDPKYWEDVDDTSEKPTSNLSVDAGDLHRFIVEKWPTFVYYTDSKTFPTYKMQDADGRILQIHLYQQNQLISLDNEPIDFFFEFVLLYRAYISIEHQLFFFNSSSWESLALKPETTEAEIKQFMGYIDA